MNQGNVALGFSEQAVTWNPARSDFLPVVTPHPWLHSLLGTHLNVEEALNWTQIDPLKKKALEEKKLKNEVLPVIFFLFQGKQSAVLSPCAVACCSYSWHSGLTDRCFRMTQVRSDEQEVCLQLACRAVQMSSCIITELSRLPYVSKPPLC